MDTLQKLHRNSFLYITFSGLLVISCFIWLQITGQREGLLNDLAGAISGIVFLISALICFAYYKKLDAGLISKAILNTGLANLFFAIGSFIWSYYTFVLKIETPYPSLADVSFIFMPIAYAVAVGSMLQIYKTSTTKFTTFISFVVFIILATVVMLFLVKPEISSELTIWENFFNFAYSLSDSVYVGAGAALLIIAGGKIYKGILIWVIAMFLITISDFVFVYRTSQDLIWNGDIADQLYTLSAIIFTYSVIMLSKTSESRNIKI